jgi:hypothetical protein
MILTLSLTLTLTLTLALTLAPLGALLRPLPGSGRSGAL